LVAVRARASMPANAFDRELVHERATMRLGLIRVCRFPTHRNSLVENSVELIDMPSYNNRGKNSSDIKLVVDALELAITRSHVDTFVIVSGFVDDVLSLLIVPIRDYRTD